MDNLIDRLPEILQSSGDRFAVFALVVVVLAAIGFLFFMREKTEVKQKVFNLMIYFFLAIVAALTLGSFSGFQTGNEVAIRQQETDPSIVKLSSSSVQKLDKYLASKGQQSNDASKARAIDQALDVLLTPPKAASSDSVNSQLAPTSQSTTRSTPQAAPSFQQVEVSGLIFDLKECRSSGDFMTCSFLVTNPNKDKQVFFYANYPGNGTSIAIDVTGTPHDAKSISVSGSYGGKFQNVRLIQAVPTQVALNFEGIPQQVNKLASVQLLTKETNSSKFSTVKFENIEITR
jgi:hypothetical protein